MLVEARRHSDRIGEVEPEGAHREACVVARPRKNRREASSPRIARPCASSASICRNSGRDSASNNPITIQAPGTCAGRLPPIGSGLTHSTAVGRQHAVEMWKQRTARARAPISARGTERRQQQPRPARGHPLPEKCRAAVSAGLLAGREMDITVAEIDRRATEYAGPFGGPPFVRPADLVDDVRHPPPVLNPACCGPPPRGQRNPSILPSRPQIRTITLK